ncbi:MAG: hypothetical protein COA32_14750 [Fluviicola sp.]|nr:MAG: hypothetical protein COA32_14750 [Fluviicola sp.]
MKEFLSKHIDFTNEEYESLISIAKLKEFKKDEYLLRAGSPVRKLFFVKSGFMRGYRIHEGEDITHHFYLHNWFATDYESYLTKEPGELYIKALIDTSVYEFDQTTLNKFFKTNEKFEKIRFIQAEDAYLRMVRRLKNFQYLELKDRYLALINKNPELFNLVPQRYIASYLGVTPQSISRIKKEL